jgi:hypothetical protein
MGTAGTSRLGLAQSNPTCYSQPRENSYTRGGGGGGGGRRFGGGLTGVRWDWAENGGLSPSASFLLFFYFGFIFF